MGITAMIPDMTIGQLMNEAAARYGEIWDPHATRMTLLLLCPRKERKMMELHGDMIDHGQPVVSVFHRPRAEAHLLEAQGFDPRAASFMFVNIATADMGPWMQQLVNNEGWLRNSIQLASTPFSVGLPSQRPFEAMQTLCFRHPSLPALEQYYLPFPAESLPGKCFVSLPRRAAAEMARQQAEVLGVGRLEKPTPPEPEPVPEPVVEVEAEPTPEAPPEPEPPAPEPVAVPLPAAPAPEPAEDSVPLPPTTGRPSPFGPTLLPIEPIQNAPRGSLRPSLNRNSGQPPRVAGKSSRTPSSGLNRINCDPRATSSHPFLSVSDRATTGRSNIWVRVAPLSGWWLCRRKRLISVQ